MSEPAISALISSLTYGNLDHDNPAVCGLSVCGESVTNLEEANAQLEEMRVRLAALNERNADLEAQNRWLKGHEAQLRSLIDANVLGVLIVETTGQVLDINAQFCYLLGQSREEMMASPFDLASHVSAEAQAQVKRQERILWESAFCPAWETTLVRKNGQLVPILTGAALVDVQPRQILMWALDVTARQQFESELLDSSTRLRTIVENLHEGLLLTDLDDVVLYANRHMAQLCGYEMEEMIGKPAYELLSLPEMWPEARNRNEGRKRGQAEVYESLMHRKDGSLWWGLVSGAPLRNAHGEIVGTLGAISDISSRKEADARQEQLALELQRSNAELQSFAYAVSHDLKEPLRKIEVFGSRLETGAILRLDDQNLDYLRRMKSAARRMNGLVDGLLEYSRVTTHSSAFERVDLGLVFTEVMADFEIELENSGALIQSRHWPVLRADARQMRQLLQNLLSNSLKFRRDNETARINIEGWSRESRCGFSFFDNGRGFEPHEAEAIFQIFLRLEGKNFGGKSATEGSGIGLSVCRRIVERHNGTIIARGVVGQGATFEVELPL